MKKVILSVAVIAIVSLVSCKDQTTKESESETVTQTEEVKEMAKADLSFGVRGNCGMCETTIEKAAMGVVGVTMAEWDVDKKKIDVSFDDAQTNADAIHNAIAASGYDTDKVMGNPDAYDKLPGCCQYDHTMAMNQSGEKAEGNHLDN